MSVRADERGVILPCPGCGRSNRIAYDQLTKRTRCGKCKAELAAPAQPVEIQSGAAFEALVAHSALPILVDCWAPWCGPCRMVAPELEKLAAARQGSWVVAKVNTDELQELAARLRIRSIPTLLLFAGGSEVERTAGVRPAAQIEQFVEGALAKSRASAGSGS